MARTHERRTLRGRALVAAALTAGALIAGLDASHRPTVTIQILAISDWHAQLDPSQGVGGAAVLAAYFQADRASNPNTLTVTAGDAYGASPPVSSFLNEEPAVIAMRMMGFDADTFGNHNFDRGIAHLQSMIDLAAAGPAEQPGRPFHYVAANLANLDTNLTGVAPYRIFDVGGVKVAVIGITNPEAPSLVRPGNFGSIEVTDPVRAAAQARARARQDGAKIFVALTHLGVTSVDPNTGEASGPLIDFANSVGGFDVIFGDHTDFRFEAVIGNTLVVENLSRGRSYSKTALEVDARNGRIVARSNAFVTPAAAAVTPDPGVTALIDSYRAQLTPLFSKVIGHSAVEIPRGDACGRPDGRLCESKVGNVVADAIRHAYGVDFAIVNSGGLRAALTCPVVDSSADFCPPFAPPPFLITRVQPIAVLPFGNVVVTLQVNGAELKTMLENGVSAMPAANGRFPQVSGLCFAYDVAAPAGSRVTGAVLADASGACTATPIDLTAGSTYTLAENDFMASGGDGYPNFFSRSVTRDVLEQMVAEFVAEKSPINPTIQGRITCTSSGAAACPTVVP